MTITRLILTDFRSHTALTVNASAGFVVITGPNGAGKTNILEALSLLAPGRGLRGAKLSEMSRIGGAGGFAVAARLADAVELGTGAQAQAPERRLTRINGAQASANSLAEWLALVWLTPAMDRLFTDTAGGRRRFIDRLVLALDPRHAGEAQRYEAAVRQRNRLLSDDRSDPAWLDAIEAALARHGLAIAQARAKLVAVLDARLAAQTAGPFARAALAISGWSGNDEGELLAALRAGRAQDAAAGRTLAGPHRSDLLVQHRDKKMPAAHCSTGEQKALLIGIILTHAALVAERTGRPPLLLLDEVAAHLDPVRRAALFAQLAEAGGQAWLTGTEAALFHGIEQATRIEL
jgi:DNA replication and repair protein RecF